MKLIGYSSDEDIERFLRDTEDYNNAIKFPTYKKIKKTAKVKETKRKQLIIKKTEKCCYCNIILTNGDPTELTSKTRDHIIPKHRGGKLTLPCCLACNRQKGGLMLHSYIQLLEMMGGNEVKIRNAKKILASLEK